jgi:quinol monooxygenase YgiN
MNAMPEQEPVQVLLPGRRCLLVRLTAATGRRLELLDVINTYADGLREEPGTELFMVSLDPDDENLVWMYELFRDEGAENAHRAASGFAEMLGGVTDLLDGPPAVLRMEPIRMAVQEGVLSQDWSL